MSPGQTAAAAIPSPDDWSALIERTARGDQAALATLYDGTAGLVNGLALRILRDTTAAEEVTGDVYLQVWRQAVRFDPTRGRPLAWLLMVTRTRAIDRLRAVTGERSRAAELATAVPAMPAGSGPEDECSAAERRRFVQGALSRLPPEQRQVIELAYFGGLSQSEIATTLDQPLGTVKTRIRLGMRRLREALDASVKECA